MRFSRFQFIPQMIFLNCLFGYLSLLIIVKWCIGSQADLYHVMIYMFLSPTDELGENQLFAGQKTAQVGSIFSVLFIFIFIQCEMWAFQLLIPCVLFSDCAIVTGTRFCAMDASSKAFAIEETAPRCMP